MQRLVSMCVSAFAEAVKRHTQRVTRVGDGGPEIVLPEKKSKCVSNVRIRWRSLEAQIKHTSRSLRQY